MKITSIIIKIIWLVFVSSVSFYMVFKSQRIQVTNDRFPSVLAAMTHLTHNASHTKHPDTKTYVITIHLWLFNVLPRLVLRPIVGILKYCQYFQSSEHESARGKKSFVSAACRLSINRPRAHVYVRALYELGADFK